MQPNKFTHIITYMSITYGCVKPRGQGLMLLCCQKSEFSNTRSWIYRTGIMLCFILLVGGNNDSKYFFFFFVIYLNLMYNTWFYICLFLSKNTCFISFGEWKQDTIMNYISWGCKVLIIIIYKNQPLVFCQLLFSSTLLVLKFKDILYSWHFHIC